jgi:hypothetical protein
LTAWGECPDSEVRHTLQHVALFAGADEVIE